MAENGKNCDQRRVAMNKEQYNGNFTGEVWWFGGRRSIRFAFCKEQLGEGATWRMNQRRQEWMRRDPVGANGNTGLAGGGGSGEK